MEFELSKFGPNSRTSMQNKLKQYRLDIDLMQKDLVSYFNMNLIRSFIYYLLLIEEINE